jgi:hypothetical protein
MVMALRTNHQAERLQAVGVALAKPVLPVGDEDEA